MPTSAQEAKLKKNIDGTLSPIMKLFYEQVGKSEISDEKIEKFIDDNMESFLDELVDSAIDFKNFIKSDWEKELTQELIDTGVIETESWVKKNLSIYMATPQKAADKLDSIRFERIDDFRKAFNSGFDVRISQDRFTAGDIEWIKAQVNQKNRFFFKEEEGMERLFAQLNDINKFSVEDMDRLKEWLYRRNELWARDQSGDIYAQQCEELSLQNGIEEFDWITERDRRVREKHLIRDGKRFRFDTVDYLPGQEVLCRCHLRPVKKARK